MSVTLGWFMLLNIVVHEPGSWDGVIIVDERTRGRHM